MSSAKTKQTSFDRAGLIVVIVGAVLGLVAAFVLSMDAITLAKDSHAVLSCSVNLVINCSTVAQSAAADILGFPNSFIGMMAMPVLITIAVIGLIGVTFPRWFIKAMIAGVLAGIAFAGWMFYQSFVVIQVLCPWCLLTDVSMLLIAYGIFRYAARSGVWSEKTAEFSRKNYDLMITIATIVLIIAIIFLKYGKSLFA